MVDLMGKKYIFFALSILIMISGIIGYVVHDGFNLDIQFEGGTIMNVNLEDRSKDVEHKQERQKKAEEIILKTVNKKASVQISNNLVDTKSPDILTISISRKDTLDQEQRDKVIAALKEGFKLKKDVVYSAQSVAPFIGDEIRENGLKAIAVLSVLIILYVWFRFRVMSGLSAGVTAVIALLHDAMVMVSVYTIFDVKVNESFIAAILTVIGYSMNDTIIIYDRVRENSNLLRKMPISELVNKSIIQTLSRSINTVLTVLISITTVFVYASINNIETVKEFAFPLIVGIASGCYSSIFVASPLYVIWKEFQNRKKVIGKAAKA